MSANQELINVGLDTLQLGAREVSYLSATLPLISSSGEVAEKGEFD